MTGGHYSRGEPSQHLDSKGRTPKQRHDAWIKWRKRIVDENFPDMCSCLIGTGARIKRTKCCQLVSCGMRIKNDHVDQHLKECKVCSRPDLGPVSGMWPVGSPVELKEKYRGSKSRSR